MSYSRTHQASFAELSTSFFTNHGTSIDRKLSLWPSVPQNSFGVLLPSMRFRTSLVLQCTNVQITMVQGATNDLKLLETSFVSRIVLDVLSQSVTTEIRRSSAGQRDRASALTFFFLELDGDVHFLNSQCSFPDGFAVFKMDRVSVDHTRMTQQIGMKTSYSPDKS